jgi:hypothetical protein
LRSIGKLSTSHHTPILIAILLISLLLRWVLIVRGGQYYIADETRYEVSRDAARLLVQGQWTDAFRQFTISPEHLAFKVVGTIPALMEHIAGPSLVLPAVFFSLFSVLNLYLLFLLAHRTRISSRQPVYALLFGTSCLSLLYYSRHLFPYDMSMSIGLSAIYVALVQSRSAKTALACGGLSFLCFMSYNGYWPLAGFAMLSHSFLATHKRAGILKNGVWTAAGFLGPFLFLILIMLLSGTNMISAYRLFAASITQGAFEEGGSLPFVYFWHAEHFVILILGCLAVYAAGSIVQTRQKYASLWAAAIVLIYLCLFIPSVFLHSFVVYARLARQLIPFIVLLAAHGLALLETRKRISALGTRILWAFMLMQFAFNYGQSYGLDYPRQFSEKMQSQYRGFEFSTKRLAYGAPTICQNHGYMIENAKYFLSAPETRELVSGQLLREVPHPVNFFPYQYEGYTPEQRLKFRERQLTMRFSRVSKSDPGMDIKNCAIRGEAE